MRERRDAAGGVKPFEDFGRRRREARHERRAATRQPDLECHIRVFHVAAGDERTRDPRPSRRFSRIVQTRRKNRIGVESNAERRESIDDLAHAIDPALTLFRQKALEHRRPPIEEVSKHMHVRATADGSDLDAGDEFDTGGSARQFGRLASRDGIVIGDGKHRDACG